MLKINNLVALQVQKFWTTEALHLDRFNCTVRTPDIEYHFKPGIYHLKYPENFELNSNILNSDR